MRTQIFFTILMSLLISSVMIAQEKIKPKILKNVRSVTVRDEKLETAILSVRDIGFDLVENDMRYYYNLVDLNDDKKPEVIVFLFGRSLCGTSGCDAMLFQRVGSKYKLVTSFGPARNPIIVSQTKTNGWRDLIFYNAGGGIFPGYYSIARFNGRTYPSNPTVEQDAPPLKTKITGTAFVVGEYGPDFGLRFRRRK